MIGTKIGGGVVIAVTAHKDQADLAAIVVHAPKRLRDEYITGLVRVNAAGECVSPEWSDGQYRTNVQRALVDMLERSGHIQYNSLIPLEMM